MQTRKNRKNKTFNRKNRGGGPNKTKSKNKSKKNTKLPEKSKFKEFSSPTSPKDFLSTTFFITKDISNKHKALKDFHSFLSDLKYKKYKYTQNEQIIQIINGGIEFYNEAKTNNKTEEVITKKKGDTRGTYYDRLGCSYLYDMNDPNSKEPYEQKVN